MIVLENLLILAIFGFAIGFIIKKIYAQFTSKSGSCASGCSSCKVDFEIPESKN